MHKWYDTLTEPKRALVFFIPAFILIVGTAVPNDTVNIVSWVVLLGALISRMFYIHGKR